jgi:hypothetical protein
MTCETTIPYKLNMSCIIAEDIRIGHEPDSAEKTQSLAYIDEFYATIKPFNSHMYDVKITALSTLYSALIRAVISGSDYTDVLAIFKKLRCFILENKNYTYENGLYLRSVAFAFRRAVVTVPSLSITFSQAMDYYVYALADINKRFRCVSVINSEHLK